MRELTLKNKYSLKEMFLQSTLVKMLMSSKMWLAFLSIQSVSIGIASLRTSSAPIDVIKYVSMHHSLELVLWLGILIVVDLITGVTKVWALEKRIEVVTSTGLRETIIKFVQYGSFLIITYIITHHIKDENGKVLLAEYQFTLSWATKFCMLIEIKSVYENITAMNKRLDFIKPLISKISELLKTKKEE